MNCHTVHGRGGEEGPDLSQVGAKRDRAWLERAVRDMRYEKPDTKMPPVPPEKLSDQDLKTLLDWLTSLR